MDARLKEAFHKDCQAGSKASELLINGSNILPLQSFRKCGVQDIS